MKYPCFNEEKKLWKQGYDFVVGLDEAGRGPLAGPVVAAAVMIKPKRLFFQKISARRSAKIFNKNFGIRDSKKLSEKQREFFYKKLTNHKGIKWGVGIVSEKIIDKINILEATKLAMQKALRDLKINQSNTFAKSSPTFNGREKRENFIKADFLLIDGNFKLLEGLTSQYLRGQTLSHLSGKEKPIIKGDQKVFSIAAASIIAKVTRDRIMKKMHKKYPNYGFDKHKGYGTFLHLKNLNNFGPCKTHRKSFFPVSELIHT